MRTILILINLLLLAGCATTPMSDAPINKNMSWTARQTELNRLQNWHAQGAVAVRYNGHAQTANVDLIQTGANYHMELYGPLGAGRVRLEGQPGKVILKASTGAITHAKTPEALLQKQLGWSLPINNFYYWLRGLPAPKLPNHIVFDHYNHIAVLQQQGWSIHYLRYSGINGIDLPTKIIMKNESLQATIVVSQWQFN